MVGYSGSIRTSEVRNRFMSVRANRYTLQVCVAFQNQLLNWNSFLAWYDRFIKRILETFYSAFLSPKEENIQRVLV